MHKKLLDWFAQNKETLPWRAHRDSYRVWISEIMLQQTQVATVIPYFTRFVEKFPNVASLAAASLDEVLKVWEGLGYYARARNLHKAAQIIMQNYDGSIPSSPSELQRLPGVGRYTAGAIASLAFGLNSPILDGNVIRVFSRLWDIDENVDQAATQKKLWALADDLLPNKSVGEWNEALMELGRLICLPRAPICETCPIQSSCLAYQNGTQRLRPIKAAKQALPHYDVSAGITLRTDGKFLITQRPLDGLLGGLWEFPGGKRLASESLEQCVIREIKEELDIQVEILGKLTQVSHAYTHFKITLHAFWCRFVGGSPQTLGCIDFAWVTPDDLDRYAFPVADKKILQLIKAYDIRQLALDS